MEQHGENLKRRAQEVLIPEDPAEIEPKQTLDTGTPPIRAISASEDLRQWLARGWKDLLNAPQALVHGLVVAAVGLLIILFAVWATVVWRWIGVLTMGDLGAPQTMGEVLGVMLASPQGMVSLLGVIAAGAVFALAVFAISVVTLPAMLERQKGFVDALAVSLKAFKTNPWPLLVWGLAITALFALSAATAFIALIVIFPWLGFAMWHGYRSLVARNGG